MQSPTNVRKYLNPIVFSQPDDGNPNCADIELLSLLLDEDDAVPETCSLWEGQLAIEHKKRGGETAVIAR